MDFSKEILDILIAYVGEGIHVIDKDGKTIVYNKGMQELEGLDISEVLGKKLLEVFPSLNENTSTLCSTLNTGEIIVERYQSYINKKGFNITAVNTTVPIKRNNEIIGAVEISRDFTRIKELYDRIIHNPYSDNGTKSQKLTFDSIVGINPKFIQAVETAKKAARTNSSVLIYGDTGTGKEVFAKCIHNGSSRSNAPFIAVNCAAMPEGLLEGILFGTVKGGFTGAVNRPGLFEQADGGTLLLDEINSMSISLQAKLLRVLQEGCVRRVGDIKDIQVDVKIIATTNEEPSISINSGRMRKDLYYRLSVINITIPPLNERKDDIHLFIKEFLRKYNEELSKDVWDITKEVYDAFMTYNWGGNIRELKNYIEGAMNMVTGHILSKEHFTPQVQEILFGQIKTEEVKLSGDYDYDQSLDEFIENVEKKVLKKALIDNNFNISETARALKIKRQTLQHKIKRYNIQIDKN